MDMHTFNDLSTVASTNVPKYLSISGIGFPGSWWQSVDVFCMVGMAQFVLQHTCTVYHVYTERLCIWFVFMYGAHLLALKGSIM